MTKLSDKEEDWLKFSISYLNIAAISCEEMLRHNYDKTIDHDGLYIPTIYNIKHGIESFIKSGIVILESKNVLMKDKNHDLEQNYSRLLEVMKKNEKLIKIASKKLADWAKEHGFVDLLKTIEINPSTKQINVLGTLIFKYQKCEFIKELIGSDYTVDDFNNATFRYPQNELRIELDYGKILSKVSIKNIEDIRDDVRNLKEIFYSYWLIFTFFKEDAGH